MEPNGKVAPPSELLKLTKKNNTTLHNYIGLENMDQVQLVHGPFASNAYRVLQDVFHCTLSSRFQNNKRSKLLFH